MLFMNAFVGLRKACLHMTVVVLFQELNLTFVSCFQLIPLEKLGLGVAFEICAPLFQRFVVVAFVLECFDLFRKFVVFAFKSCVF